MKRYTNAYTYNGRKFIYDRKTSVVNFVKKATKEDYEDAKRLPYVFEIINGYFVIDSIGLSRESWENKELRDEYLYSYIFDINEEADALLADFEKYELPELLKEI